MLGYLALMNMQTTRHADEHQTDALQRASAAVAETLKKGEASKEK